MTVARWSWLGDRLAIDVANTVRRRGWRYLELITSPADLAAWLDHEHGRLAIPAQMDTALVSRFLLIRDQVLRVLRAAAGGAALPAADVHAINELAAAAPTTPLLETIATYHLFLSMIRAPQTSTLFPYTTVFP